MPTLLMLSTDRPKFMFHLAHKNATYPPAVDNLKQEDVLSEDAELRLTQYLNNRVEPEPSPHQTLGQTRFGLRLFQYSSTHPSRV